MKITTAIITKQIPEKRFLDRLVFAHEIIIVIDQENKKSYTKGKIKYFFHPLKGNFSAQRNFALSKSVGDWVFFVDDDEVVGTQLAREIIEKTKDTKYSAFSIPRRDVFFHQVLNHGETGQTKLVRLARKGAGIFRRSVHESWAIKGRVGEISSPLYHIKDRFLSEFIPRMIQYGSLDAPILTEENKPFSYTRLFLNPSLKFIQNYFLRAGFLDGYPGLFQSLLMSVQSLSVRVFQWTNKNSS